MASEYTPNYQLDLYVSTDKPNLRDQYNAAMGKVDAAMKDQKDAQTAANNNIYTLQTQMTSANGSISALQTDVSTLQTQMTSANGSISALQTDVSALESTVEAHGTQITGAQKTADDALSLAQTNESDIAGVETSVTQIENRIESLYNLPNSTDLEQYLTSENVYQYGSTLTDVEQIAGTNVDGTLIVISSDNGETYRLASIITITASPAVNVTKACMGIRVPLSALPVNLANAVKGRKMRYLGCALQKIGDDYTLHYGSVLCDDTYAYFGAYGSGEILYSSICFMQIPVFLNSNPFPNKD